MARPHSLVCLVLLFDCERNARQNGGDDVVVHAELATLKTEPIGLGEAQHTASFVLVDATNHGPAGHVTLAGDWLDAHGARIGQLAPQSRFLPTGATRTFVLVDARDQARQDVVSASVQVRSINVEMPDVPALATNPKTLATTVQTEAGRVPIVSATADITNQSSRPGCLLVGAAFHSPGGRPLAWQHTWLPVGPASTRGVQFFSPPGAEKAFITVDEWTEPQPRAGYCFGKTQ